LQEFAVKCRELQAIEGVEMENRLRKGMPYVGRSGGFIREHGIRLI